jgi:hypothetical protein
VSAWQNDTVDLDELTALLSTEALRLLSDTPAPEKPSDVPHLVTRLRKAGHDPELVRAVVNQLALRAKARDKFGDFANRMLVTKAGLEQATRLEVASHHAGRFRDRGMTSVVDAGCGIGGDSLAFAGIGLRVHAIEQDEATAALAAYNLAPFDTVTVTQGDATAIDFSEVDALWIDPARRNSDRRLSNPDDWSPSLTWVWEVARAHPTGVKLAPGMDRSLIPETMEASWISYGGSVVELVVWSGTLQREGITRSALVINSRGTEEATSLGDATDQPVGPVHEFLYEPDGAVIRARLIGDVARFVGGTMIDATIAYFTAPVAQQSPLWQVFQIVEQVPYTLKNVQKMVRDADVRTLEIKKRGVDVDPHELRHSLSLEGSGEATLIITRVAGKKTALLAKRLDSIGEDVAHADQESESEG